MINNGRATDSNLPSDIPHGDQSGVREEAFSEIVTMHNVAYNMADRPDSDESEPDSEDEDEFDEEDDVDEDDEAEDGAR
jgi:hypothetical protein